MTVVVLKRRTVLGSMVALAGLGGTAKAFAEPDPVDLQVINRETGLAMAVWRKGERVFVAGDLGQRYSLRIANRTDGRVLTVLSVDGINIVSGDTAGYDGRGYILSPYETYDIQGWRKSQTEIAAFSFTALPNSYAAETGRPANVGVIGMAVFKERPRPTITPLAVTPAPPPPPRGGWGSAARNAPVAPPPLPIPPVEKPIQAPPGAAGADAGSSAQSVVVTGSRIQRRDYTQSPPSNSPKAFEEAQRQPDEKLGTGHGAREWSVVNIVPFDRATPYPQLVRQIEYDSYANLIRIGVIPPPRPDRPPRAFPGAPGYVPDPPRP